MRHHHHLLLLALTSTLLRAAPTESVSKPASARDQVLQVVQSFFNALAQKDGETLNVLCAPGGQITVAPAPEMNRPLRRRSTEDDAESIKKNTEAWLERMWNPTVLVEGRIAVVWTPYDFHRDGKFSHNGTDVFTLMKLADGWKIVSAAYTKHNVISNCLLWWPGLSSVQ